LRSSAPIHIVTPEYPPAIGGVADYTRQIAQGLAAAGEEVHVWCPGRRPDEIDPSVVVHAELGRFGRSDLDRMDALLNQYPAPRRLLVQWVPHGYGFRSMNLPFCVWLWHRAHAGDRIELMVHEPSLAFWEGNWRQAAAASIHRIMTAVLLRAAHRVWVSIPAWETRWRPYALGRSVPFTWLPIPTALTAASDKEVCAIRSRVGTGCQRIIGHFGTFGSHMTASLDEVLPRILTAERNACVLLVGAGSRDYEASFLEKHRDFAGRVQATGPLDPPALASHVAACDVLVQPYPDGVSSRRTTTMAGLFLGVPVVTTSGHLTESFWNDSSAVRLSRVGDWAAFVDHVCRLLGSADERRRMSEQARRFYDQTFDVRHTIAALKAAS